jgi:antagonist of KipI
MSIVFTKEPVLTTVQDLGRRGYQKLGINPNGTMDRTAARIANILVGNDETSAVLEMHFPAGEIKFETGAVFSLGGADYGAELDGQRLDVWKSYAAGNGSVLRFVSRHRGTRAYLAVSGGFDVAPWLGSASTNLTAKAGGFEGRRLRKDDGVGIKETDAVAGLWASRSLIPIYNRFPTVRVVAGPEYESLTEASRELLVNETFTVGADSNRMGFRLAGRPLSREPKAEMVSSPVTFGSIQLLPDGQLIILMADHQTTGGYPRIANVTSFDLPLVAQLDAGYKIGFELVSIEEAEELLLGFERELVFLKMGVRFARTSSPPG